MRGSHLSPLAPWRWRCTECGEALLVQVRYAEQDGWAMLQVEAVEHLRKQHHDFSAERTFWESDWSQGGEPFDWEQVEPEPELEWDDDEANALARDGWSLRELGRRYGIDAETVRRRLTPETMREREKARRGRAAIPEVRKRVRRLLSEGVSMREVAERCGVSRRQVERIKYAGPPKRSSRAAKKSSGPLAAQMVLMLS